jgi:hypothetical protein
MSAWAPSILFASVAEMFFFFFKKTFQSQHAGSGPQGWFGSHHMECWQLPLSAWAPSILFARVADFFSSFGLLQFFLYLIRRATSNGVLINQWQWQQPAEPVPAFVQASEGRNACRNAFLV